MYARWLRIGNTGAWLTLMLLAGGLGAQAAPIVLTASADTHIRSDLDARTNDNYGMNTEMPIGTSRGGLGTNWGDPDAQRILVQFDLTPYMGMQITSAIFEMTILTYQGGTVTPTQTYQFDVHRVTAPWVEGIGSEGFPFPPGSDSVDSAAGVDWLNQPTVDPTVAATKSILASATPGGTTLQWDITSVVQKWLDGTYANNGIEIVDPTTDGNFRAIYFGSTEGLAFGVPGAVQAPQLVVTPGVVPLPAMLVPGALLGLGVLLRRHG